MEKALRIQLCSVFRTYISVVQEIILEATLSNKLTYRFSITLGADRINFTPHHNTDQQAQIIRFAHFPMLEKKLKTTPPIKRRNIIRSIFSPIENVYYMFELLATSKYNKSFQNWMTSMFPTCQRIEISHGKYELDNNILCATEHGKLQLQDMGNDFSQTFLILVTIFHDKIKYGSNNDLYVYTVVDDTFVVSPTLKKKFHELKVQLIHATKQIKQKRRKLTSAVSELT
jgi:hypothetical protein